MTLPLFPVMETNGLVGEAWQQHINHWRFDPHVCCVFPLLSNNNLHLAKKKQTLQQSSTLTGCPPCTAGPCDWHVSCWRPAPLQQPWTEIRKWVISASVAEGYTQAIPILATANIHTPNPPVELHLRNDHTPSLPPQTNKHTTHPTWYVLSFILCSGEMGFNYSKASLLQV